MQRLVVAGLLALLAIELSPQANLPAVAQDMRMRQRSSWNGDPGPARPRQGWTPGADNYAQRSHQAALQNWQQAEQLSAGSRVTPQNVIRSSYAQIQQAEASGNFAAAADGYARLADTLAAPGMSVYAGGLTVLDCYKKEVGARLSHINQASRAGDVASESSEWNAVQRLADNLATREPMDSRWCFLQGMSYYHQGAYKGAEERLSRCLTMPNCSPEVRADCNSTLAAIRSQEQRAAQKAKQEQAAAEAARRRQAEANAGKQTTKKADNKVGGMTLDSDKALAAGLVKYCGLGKQAFDNKRYDEAIANYKQALATVPNFPDAYFNMGMAYAAKHDLPNAEAAFRKATRLDSKDAESWFNLGGILEAQHRKTEAEDCYMRARDLHDPNVQKEVEQKLAKMRR